MREWLEQRRKKAAQKRRMELQKIDEAHFNMIFEYVKSDIQARCDCTQEQKDRMITSAEKTHKEAIESRRKARERGEDIPIGI